MSANEAGMSIELAGEADFALGALRVRPSSRQVVTNGRADMLEPRVMQVLVALARRNGEVVARDELIACCWGGRAVGEDAINRSITKVRKLSSPGTFTLETIPRVGYRLVANAGAPAVEEKEQAKEKSAPVVEVAAPMPAPAAKSPRRRLRLILALCAVAMLMVGGFMMWVLFNNSRYVDVKAQSYFAVLPFDAVGTDAKTAYLADAIPSAVGNQFMALGFQGVSPAVSFEYRGARKAEAAQKLQARYIIDGTVRLEGSKLHVATRVDSGPWHVGVYSQEFDVDVADAGALPERIAASLAGIFNPSWRSMPGGTPKIVAGILRIAARRREGDDMGAYLAAKQLLRDAPNSAVSQVYYASAASGVLDLFPVAERASLLAGARKAADLAAKYARAEVPLGASAVIPLVDWSEREQVLRGGLETDPNAERRYALAAFLAFSGRTAEAISAANQALTLDSLASNIMLINAGVLEVAGHLKESEVLLARAAKLWPGVEPVERLRYSGAIARGDLQAAAAMLHDPTLGPIIDPPASQHSYPAVLRALTTRSPADIAEVERVCADPSSLARDRGLLCLRGLVMLGRLDTFFKLAPVYFPEQRGESDAERDVLWLKYPRTERNLWVLFRTDMQAVRADARFIPIVERMGLLDYWRASGKWPDFCDSEPGSVCARMRGR